MVARLLTSLSDSEVIMEAYRFLHDARSVTFEWLLELQDKLKNPSEISAITEYQHRVCEIAAICRSTFDIDPHHIPSLLMDPTDRSILIRCSIILYNNTPATYWKIPEHIQFLLCCDRRLSHKLLPQLLQQLNLDRHTICGPISDLWPDYRSSKDGWTEPLAPNTRWTSTITKASHEQDSRQVHLDLLKGRLLIDGKPLGRLPRRYIQHPTYIRLFDEVKLPPIHHPFGYVGLAFIFYPADHS